MLYSQTPGTFRERTETCNSYNSTFFLDWAICNMQMALITIQLILCVIYDLNLCYNSWQTYQLLQISINEWVLWQRQFQNWVIAKQSCICLKNKMKQKKKKQLCWCLLLDPKQIRRLTDMGSMFDVQSALWESTVSFSIFSW